MIPRNENDELMIAPEDFTGTKWQYYRPVCGEFLDVVYVSLITLRLDCSILEALVIDLLKMSL